MCDISILLKSSVIIVLIGTAIYCYKTQCKFDNKHYSVDDDLNDFHHNDDTNEREKPLLSENVSKSYLLQMTIPKLNLLQGVASLNGKSYRVGPNVNYTENLTEEQIYIRSLPTNFKQYLEKRGAVDPNTGTILKQIQIKEDQIIKLHALGASNFILNELQSKYKVLTLKDDDDDDNDLDELRRKKDIAIAAVTILKNLPVKFFSWLVKQKAINEDCEILNQVDINDEFLEKLHKLGVTNATLNDLENKFKVISTSPL